MKRPYIRAADLAKPHECLASILDCERCQDRLWPRGSFDRLRPASDAQPGEVLPRGRR